MESDVREMMEHARRQSNEFMQQSREQARQQMAYQQQSMTAAFSTASGAGGGGGAPSPGTPAGRLMDTISTLVQRGVSAGGGAVTGAYGAGMGQIGAMGAMAGGFAASPIDLGGAMFTTQQRNMRFMQTLAAAVPLGFGAQRLDMTSEQAMAMAREELGARASRGAMAGLAGLGNAMSLGVLGYTMRLHGHEQAWQGREDIAAGLQQQFRYVRRSALDQADMGDMAGPFSTGITRAGAREIAGQMATDVYAPMQRQYGMTGAEMSVIGARAMGTMGRQGVEDLLGSGRTVRSGALKRQMNSVIEVQQLLNLSTEEADQFWGMVGQMHGTAEKMAQRARQARRMGGALGLATREVTQNIMEFERVGIQTGMGADRARAVAENYTQSIYETFRRGGISSEQMMRHGGNTPEEGLRHLMQARFQENLGMWAGGAGMMGTGVLTGTAGWGQLMGGHLGFMGAMGAVGQEMVRDPFAVMRRRFDPSAHRDIGMGANRAMYQMARRMPAIGTADQQRVQRIAWFQSQTNLSDLDSTAQVNQFEMEEAIAGAMLPGAREGAAAEVAGIYSAIVGTGMSVAAAKTIGGGSVWEAAKKIWERSTKGGKTAYDAAIPIDVALRDMTRGSLTHAESEELMKTALDSDVVQKADRRQSFFNVFDAAGRALQSEAGKMGVTLTSDAMSKVLLGPSGARFHSDNKTAGLGFDETGALIVSAASFGNEKWIGRRLSDLRREEPRFFTEDNLVGGADAKTFLTGRAHGLQDPRTRTSGTAQSLRDRLMAQAVGNLTAGSKALGLEHLEQALAERATGVMSYLFGAEPSGKMPMQNFMQQVADMETNANQMQKAAALGLTGFTTFASMFQRTAQGVALSDESVTADLQRSLLSIGVKSLAPVLGKSEEELQGMLTSPDKLGDVAALLRETDVPSKIFGAILNSMDLSKFNVLGTSDVTAMHVKLTKDTLAALTKPTEPGPNMKPQ